MSQSIVAPTADPVSAGRAMDAALCLIKDGLQRLAELDMAVLDDDRMGRLATVIAESESRLAGLQARAVDVASRSGAVQRSGASTAGSWLVAQTNSSIRKASTTTRVADAISELPSLGEALAAGDITSEHARVVSDVIKRGVLDDGQRERLVRDAAVLTPERLAGAARRREAVMDPQRLKHDEELARARRYLRQWTEPDGSVSGSYRLDPVAGQLFSAGLGACDMPDPVGTPDDQKRSFEQRQADALLQLARKAAEADVLGTTHAVKPHITVVVPVAMLHPSLEQAEAAGAYGTAPDGTTYSAAWVRQLLCDASVRRMVIDPASQPLDIGRATREWNGAQRAALAAVDGGCRGPRCDRPFAWTDIHHIRWWRFDGQTKIDNGIPLCRLCHNLVHHNGWEVLLEPRGRIATWTSPAGELITTRPRGPAAPDYTVGRSELAQLTPAQPTPASSATSEPFAAAPAEVASAQPRLVFERRGRYDVAPAATRAIGATPRPLAAPAAPPTARASSARAIGINVVRLGQRANHRRPVRTNLQQPPQRHAAAGNREVLVGP